MLGKSDGPLILVVATMPMCTIVSAVALPSERQTEMLTKLETAISEATGKPLNYVMVGFQQMSAMRFGGSDAPCAFVSLSSIGSIDAKKNNTVCQKVASICNAFLGVPENRVFSTFTDVPAVNFGLGSNTFG